MAVNSLHSVGRGVLCVSYLLFIETDFFLSDIVHCRLGMCNWAGTNLQIFFPEA
jgi:hypothetical protein